MKQKIGEFLTTTFSTNKGYTPLYASYVSILASGIKAPETILGNNSLWLVQVGVDQWLATQDGYSNSNTDWLTIVPFLNSFC